MGGTATLDNQNQNQVVAPNPNVGTGVNVGVGVGNGVGHVQGQVQVQSPNVAHGGIGMGSVAGTSTGIGTAIAATPTPTTFNPQIGANNNNYEESTVSSEFSINDQIYHEVIDIVEKDMGIVIQSPTLLSSESINRYLSQYWSHFDPSFPIIHKPTFKSTKASSVQKFLTLAMITIGMAFMNPDELRMVTEIEQRSIQMSIS
ncbi:unnamed protein product [Ambrosiozyma monospora]|uniref:Unnamed protein product n=1 Tax=Ambrosiozyma monospora TaxID=43982 RepID=A0A9W6YWP7_AMBMO|nr:unnamed protein product [Ambrosiozyma monospora]